MQLAHAVAPDTDENVPALQLRHADAPTVDEYVPAVQLAQDVSDATYVPA